MTRLPPGWNWTKVGYAVKFTEKPRSLRYADYDLIPFVPMEMVPIGRKRFYNFLLKKPIDLTSGTYFESGDVLVAKITPSFENGKQGIIDILPTPFAIGSTEIIPIQALPGISDRDFIFYYLLGTDIRAELASKMEGTTGRQRLSKAALGAYPIALPPLREQCAIAAALSAVQDSRDARRRELDAEWERKAALIEDLLACGLRGESLKTTKVGPLPENWDVVPFGQAVDITTGQVQPTQEPYKSMPHVGSENIASGTGRLLPLKTNGELNVISGNYLFTTEDVLYSKIRPYLNKVALPVFTGTCSADMYPLRPRDGQMTREFLFQSLLSAPFVRRTTAFQDRTGIPKINRDQLNSIPMVKPPLDEQCDIADVLTACDANIAALETEAALHDELFRALLEELMSGRLSALPLMGATP